MNMNNKKEHINILTLMIAIALMIALAGGGTYAWLKWRSANNTAVNITVTGGTYLLDGGGDITGKKMAPTTECNHPTYTIEKKITATVTNTIDTDMIAYIQLYTNSSLFPDVYKMEHLKWAITSIPTYCASESNVITSGNFSEIDNSVDLEDDDTDDNTPLDLVSFNVPANTKEELVRTFYLYIWIDDDYIVKNQGNTVVDSIQDVSFTLKLTGEMNDNTGVAATAPDEVEHDFKYTLTNVSNNSWSLDNSFYELSDYTCKNGTTLTYDPITRNITANGIDNCELEFTKSTSNPTLYDIVEIGDYISYTGDNGCVEPYCSGWNANQTATDLYENFGYCYNSPHNFYTYGWRVLYKNDNSVYIVSAGAPECVAGTSSNSTSTIASLNTAALNYCNLNYLSEGTCDTITAHAFNGDDFYKFTSQYNGTDNARYLHSYDDGGTFGTPYCYGSNNKTQYCGYNNDIIDNGGYYWFGSYSSTGMLFWNPSNRTVNCLGSGTTTYGVRPVLKLDSTILAIGGSGTMTDPYTISTRTTS